MSKALEWLLFACFVVASVVPTFVGIADAFAWIVTGSPLTTFNWSDPLRIAGLVIMAMFYGIAALCLLGALTHE